MSILFTNGDNETDGGSLELDGASFITSADVGGTTFVFVAGAVDNGVSVFALGATGGLTNTYNITDSGLLNLVGVSGLTTITSNGNTYLIAAGAGDNGVSVFRVSVSGTLTAVYDVVDGGALNLGGVSRLASATVSGNPYVFTAGTNDDGISVFRVQGDGKLTPVYDLADNGTLELDGVKGLATATVLGNVFLFAAGGVDDGVSVFNVAANGSLVNTSNVTDDATLKLDGASDVATAVVGGTTYLFVTGSVDNGVSVFSVNGSGVLTNVANVTDTAALRLAGAAGLTVNTFGATTYLTVGGTENGVSTFRVNAGGSLTLMENIDDAGSRELAGTTALHTASYAGSNFVVAAGSTDDGVSTFGLKPSGQLWFTTEGGDGDTRIVRINNDGSSQTINIDNSPATDPLPSSFQADVALDTAAGFYFGLSNSGTFGDNAFLVRGVIGSSATPTIVIDFPDAVIANGLQIDTINHRIYIGYQDGSGSAPANTGIRQYSYNPLTGAITDNGFLVTSATDTRGQESGFDILDPRDFALDATIGRLFYTELLTGGAASIGLFRLDVASPATTTQLVSQSQFPDDGSAGYIYDVEVDTSTDLVYFTTQPNAPYLASDPGNSSYSAAQNAIWYISENASSGTAVKVTLVGAVGAHPYFGDMTFDQNLRQIYVESEEDGAGSADDVIYVFQLDGAGTTATLINTFYPSPTFTSSGANIQGMVFAQVATLGSLAATSSQMAEQAGAATVLLTGAPAISDSDGDHLAGATVQITAGKFSSNEASTSDDHLAWGSSLQVSGLISGTNITVAWNAATSTLSFTGYDTFANYQAVLAAIRYYASGDNPTNYGLNTTRILTWTINDGTPDIPAGGLNTGTTQITIAAVNDAPVNGSVTSATGNEGTNIAITGLQISDADANPALQTVTVTMSVTKGVLTLLTNVSDGLTSGEISGNGTATVTISATLNEINATLAASNGALFTGNPGVSGADTLTVVTNDGGGSGSGGAQSDTDNYTITIVGVNDAPTVSGDGTETLPITNEDVANAALTNTVSTLFSGQYSDADTDAFAGVAVTVNGSSAGTGQWQYYNGSTWVNIGAASTAAAVTLAASAPLRFLPATDYNGAAPTLTVELVDASGGALTNGATVNVTTSGGTTPYSTGTVVLSHGITAVNDAPVTTGGAAVALTTIGEDSAPGAGQTVASLFSSHFTDAKDQVSGGSSANVLAGVAITANAATGAQGVYQYFDGGTWQDVPAVSPSSAFVLDTGALVRFVPAADYSGTPPALTVYMIEDSSGAVTTGATADLTTTGGSTQYGSAMTLGVTVTAVNDAPIASGSATLAAVNEDTAAPGGQTVSALFGSNFTDPDGDTLAGVAITGNATTSQGVWQYFNGAWTAINTPSEGAALVLAAGTLVRFLPAANFNGSVPALTAYLIDNSGGAVTPGAFLDVSVNGGQTRFSDASLQLTTTITAVNDTPVVPATATTVGATEQTAATLLGAVTVSDVDLDNKNGGNGDYSGASFTVQRASANATDTFAFGAGGLFTVSGGALQVGGLTFATFTSTGGVLTITFTSAAATATTALVNDVIEHIRYTNSSNAPPSSVTLNYALNDGAPGAGQGSGGAASAGGSVIVNITAVNDPHTGGASITGTAAEDQVLTAVSTVADPDGLGTLHYQWQRDVGGGYVNVGADQATYTLGDGDIGGVARVVIYYTDAGGTVESATSAATAAISASNDAPTGGVSITGTATENQVLTADTSTLADSDGLGTLHYDWQRDTGSGFASIGAADQATYTLGDSDVGGSIRLVVSYTDGQGFANSVTSASSAAIAGVNDPHTGGASVTGAAAENQVLTAVSTLADVDGLGTLHYQWQHDVGSGYVNVGTDQSTYSLSDFDVGGVVRVVISYTDGQGFAESATSAATAAISNVNNPPTGGVSITGTTTENQVLTANTASLTDADGLGTLHYQWTRGVGAGQVNVGADQATYTLGDADVGTLIGVIVTYTDQQGSAEQVSIVGTNPIAGINDPHTGGASITGTTTEDQVLTADTSTLADVDGLGTLHYQWQHDVGGGYVNVGTDQSTYSLSDSDVGGVVRVVVSYTDGQGFVESATSAGTPAIANVNDAPTGGVSITGSAAENQVLTANTSVLADADGLGTLHYAWQRDVGSGFVSFGAADQATYTLTTADVGATVRVLTSYTDGQGTAEVVTSAATAAVVAANGPHTGGVSITGTTTEDQVLTADTSSLADPGGLGAFHYQWQRSTSGGGYVNVGTDQVTYTLGDADAGSTIRVTVSYTDGGGVFESETSGPTAAIVNVNDTPVAANDANAVIQRLTVTGSVSANDSDADLGTVLTVTNVAFNFTHADQAVTTGGTVVNGGFGTLTINPDGSYSYVANREGLVVGQVVTDKFDYTIKDPTGASATAQLTVTVTGSATGDANANILISDSSAHTLTGRGGGDTLMSGGGGDIFAYEAISDTTVAAYDTITDFAHGVDTLRLTPLITSATKLTLVSDGAHKYLYIDQNGDGTADGLILSQGLGLEISDITTGVADFGFTLYGSGNGDTLTGGSGDDVIAGFDGADTLRGGGGVDLLYGGAGADTFVYGTGDSTTSHWDLVSDFTTGQDKLDISAADGGHVVIARFGSSSFVYFGDSSAVQVNGDITVDDLVVSGAVTGVTIFGSVGTETLRGGAGQDVLVAGAGATTLIGAGGADILYGGASADTFLYTSIAHSNFSAFDLIVDFDYGHDKVDISAIDGGKITLARYEGNTFIYSAPDGGGNFQSAVAVQGTQLKSTDLVTSGGASQAFVLVGDGASHNVADILVGAGGNDILYGLDGDDTLTGGGGADFLVGGTGADTFVFTATTDSSSIASDLVFDFNHAQGDRIDLSAIDAISSTGANDTFTVVTSFSNVAGQLILATPDSSGFYHLSGDVNGDGVADFVIAVNVSGTFTSADLLL